MDWRRHAASSDADDGSTRGHGLATTPRASAALIFLPPSTDDDLLLTASKAGEEHRLPVCVRNEHLAESLTGKGGEHFSSTVAGKLPLFSITDDGNEAVAIFIALSE